MKTARALGLGLCLIATASQAQTAPDAPVDRLDPAYRRSPTFRNDPFRHVFIPHWGFVFSAGASAENNTLNIRDARAIIHLADTDSMLAGTWLDVVGLVPVGSGFGAVAQGEGGLHFGGPFGRHVSIGVSAHGRGYGSATIDEDAIALLRDGNGSRQDFSLGDSRGIGLATAEAGAHAVIRAGSREGTQVTVGFGARYIRPMAYGRARSLVTNGGVIRLTNDSIIASADVEVAHTPNVGKTGNGSGIASDFLFRLEWPSSGLALEAMVANVGTVTVRNVERRSRQFNVATTHVHTVSDSLNNFELIVRDTSDVKLTLPRTIRFTASAWASRILQIDVSATAPITGDFASPLGVDLGTTWRFIRVIPLRAGLVLGGRQGIGYTGGFAIEGRTMFFEVMGQTLGGFFDKATGTGARMELGFFF